MRTRPALPVILLLLACALPLRAEDAPSITTSGTATVYVVPDKVVISIGVDSFDPALDKAKSDNEQRAAALLKAVKTLGVADADVATDRLDVSAHYRQDRGDHPGPPEVDGYNVRRAYAVTLTDMKLLDRLVDAVLRSGGNRIDGIDFQTTELRKYKDQARQMAIHAAQEKAVALAKELDCAVGKPRTINESSPARYGGYAMQNNRFSENGGAAPESDTPETLPLGKIAVEASVSVTFELK